MYSLLYYDFKDVSPLMPCSSLAQWKRRGLLAHTVRTHVNAALKGGLLRSEV